MTGSDPKVDLHHYLQAGREAPSVEAASERARPPGRECASATVTFQPRSAASMAAVSPVRPAPTTVTSGFTRQAPSVSVRLERDGNPRKVPRNFPNADPEIVTAAQHGDALAVDQLLDELAPYVRSLCARIAPAVADDATQEALLAVFRGLPSLQTRRRS